MPEDKPTSPPAENQTEASIAEGATLPIEEAPELSLVDSPTNETSIEEELQIAQDKYIRLAAEFENYKKRAQRDQIDSARYANEALLKNLLPTIDNLERALQSGKDAGANGPLLEGVELTYKHIIETVGKLGVRQISSTGDPFDPAMHQAVAQVESDTVEPNTVIEEFQKGYFLHDRILRPAMVTVAKVKSDQTEPSPAQETGGEGGIQA